MAHKCHWLFCRSLLVQRENFALGAGELLRGGGERVHIDERAAAGNENVHILLCGELAHDDLAAGAPVQQRRNAAVGREDDADIVGMLGVEPVQRLGAAVLYGF